MTDLAKYIFDMATDMNRMLAAQYEEEKEIPDCCGCGNWESINDPYGTGDTHIVLSVCSEELDPIECTAQDRRPAYDPGEIGDRLYNEKVGK